MSDRRPCDHFWDTICPRCEDGRSIGYDEPDDDVQQWVDLGGGMVVPLRELLEDDDE